MKIGTININSILLMDSNISSNPNCSAVDGLSFNVKLCSINKGENIYNDNSNLVYIFRLSFHNEDNPRSCPFSKCEMVYRIEYELLKDGLQADEITEDLALAHVIPYVREFISSISNRMGIPTLVLPAINTRIMCEIYHKSMMKKK